MHDLVIIGGGPAGLAAAATALTKPLDMVLVSLALGGKVGERQRLVGQDAPEELIGEALIAQLKETLTAHPTRVLTDYVVGLFKRGEVFHVLMEHMTLHARTVIVATGAQPRLLGVPNEWQLVGHGLGYSIPTHAHAAAGRAVAVVGATPRALQGIAELVQIAQHITHIVPYPSHRDGTLAQHLRNHPKVRRLDGYAVTAVEERAGAVAAMIVARHADMRRIPVEMVFVDLGLAPNAQIVQNLVQLDAHGFIIVDGRQQTSLPGLFAAGDVTSPVTEQSLMALGAGARATVSAYATTLARRLGMEESTLHAA